ncbi:ferredoxin [Nocardia sp. alder85J]|uniref:ferredoxin n=1 Tax=Nocardia sp. alder85J TaxID=2862949 RepID=UPI001CD685C5|nr:ferredoxin [Nocardia sp. alder85J]MCX4098452.1 ferredoxin [Nocardia sp. alder85J]
MSPEPSRLVVDRNACAGHGLCYATAPDLLGPDDQGDPVVLADPLPADRLDAGQTVVTVCPERALSLTGPSRHRSEEQSS